MREEKAGHVRILFRSDHLDAAVLPGYRFDRLWGIAEVAGAGIHDRDFDRASRRSVLVDSEQQREHQAFTECQPRASLGSNSYIADRAARLCRIGLLLRLA